jgi:hypothetical protein
MGIVVQFPSLDERQRRSSAAQLDRARHDWSVLSEYDRDAAATAMTEFYRIWFAAAERQGYFEPSRPADAE